jgi:hypothetical protein
MTRFYFVPEDWEMSEKLISWTKAKGLTEKQIEDELESFRDHQYKRPMQRADACWRNWVKNGIQWGRIETVSPSNHRRPDELSTEQKKSDIISFENDPLVVAFRERKK